MEALQVQFAALGIRLENVAKRVSQLQTQLEQLNNPTEVSQLQTSLERLSTLTGLKVSESFSCFSDLPLEMRRKIWEIAVNDHPRRLLTLQYGSFSRSGRSLNNLRHQRIPKVAWQSDVSNLHQLSPYPAISRVCAESRAAFYAGNEICFSAAVAPRTLNCELGSLAGHGHTDIKTWRALPRDEMTRSGFPFRAARDVVFLKAYWLKRRGEHELCSFMGVLERPDPDELQIENVRYLAAQCYTFSALLRMCLSRHILWLPCLEELIEVAPDDDALLPPHVKRDENWPAKVWLTRKTYTNNWISNVEKEFKNHSKDPKQIHIRASMPKLKLMTEGMLKMYMEVGDDEDKIVPFAELKFEQEGGGNKWYRLETSTFFEFMTC